MKTKCHDEFDLVLHVLGFFDLGGTFRAKSNRHFSPHCRDASGPHSSLHFVVTHLKFGRTNRFDFVVALFGHPCATPATTQLPNLLHPTARRSLAHSLTYSTDQPTHPLAQLLPQTLAHPSSRPCTHPPTHPPTIPSTHIPPHSRTITDPLNQILTNLPTH